MSRPLSSRSRPVMQRLDTDCQIWLSCGFPSTQLFPLPPLHTRLDTRALTYENWLLRTCGVGCRAAAVAILASSRAAAGEAPEVFAGRRVKTMAAATAAATAAAMMIADVRRRRVAGLPAGGLAARRSSLIRCSLRVC